MPEPAPDNLGGLLSALVRPQGSQGPALPELRTGMAALRRAAEADPRIAERIRAALDILEGREPTMPARRPESNRIGHRFDARTPI